VVHAWPQLPALGDHYRAYVAEYEPTLRRFEAGILDDEACFAAHFRSLIDFVTIILDDPALPPALLPGDWARPSAQLLFEELWKALSKPAERFFDAIYRTQGETDDKRE
jgi:phenylacetic acid degradation operon negative regulatory protein